MHEWELPIWAAWAGEKTFRETSRREHIEFQNMNISRDGYSARFDVMFANERNSVAVPLHEIDALISQLQQAAKEMRSKQRIHRRGGIDPLRELFDTALDPVKNEVFVHPRGDVVFLHRFDGHAPVAIKMKPTDIKILRAKTNAVLARLAN
ncbi:hypothetical protein MPL3356_60603 [Mesorhizobium plurifarium]|uniref:Uncharacterized protein n=1 Tax=Mesorhizobium plurifarium TaxID=69974 RepID=A0A090EAD4_MESPL|nr:hypothetical protein MPL3356_60603 [Mesorhizobium plurifarium]